MSHRYLILGLLAQNPMTGYDIRKHVKEVLSVVTNASYGTLYPTLHKLLSEGAVRMDEVEQQNRPAKKVYYITAQGQASLQKWLKKPPADDKVRREFLLKLYFASESAEPQVTPLLTQRRQRMQAKLDALQAERRTVNDLRQQWIIDYAVSMVRAEIAWLTDMVSRLSVA
ncbi:MAG: PadR family transcriptional regulator [Chloroflexota bacterium]